MAICCAEEKTNEADHETMIAEVAMRKQDALASKKVKRLILRDYDQIFFLTFLAVFRFYAIRFNGSLDWLHAVLSPSALI